MNAPQSPQPVRVPIADTQINLIDLLTVVTKRKKLALGMPLVFAVCAGLFSLTMPDVYKASTKILPHEQTKFNATAMLKELGGMVGSTGSLSIQIPLDPNTRIPIEQFVSLLRSRNIADNLIQRFDLKNAYQVALLDEVRQVLTQNTAIKAGKDGLIAIDVEDTDPKRAAQIANAYVEELLKLTKALALTDVSQRRIFFERQLQFSKAKLTEAKQLLKAASDNISADQSSRENAETAGRLLGQIAAKEIQLSAMQTYATVDEQDRNRIQQELGSLRAELANHKRRPQVSKGAAGQTEKPGAIDGVKLVHDVQYYETLYNLLAKQYEAAHLVEANDSSIIKVLDRAVEPERKFKPKRTFIILSSAAFGLLVAILWVLVSDVVRIRTGLRRTEQL